MKSRKRLISWGLVMTMILTQLVTARVQAATTPNPTSKINLNKTVEKNQWKLNEEFIVNYTIQPQDIPQNLVPEELYHKNGADISLVIDKSGSMAWGIAGNQQLASTISYVQDRNGTFFRAYHGNISKYGTYSKKYVYGGIEERLAIDKYYYKIADDGYGNKYIFYNSQWYSVDLSIKYKAISTEPEQSRSQIVNSAANAFIDKFQNYSNVRIGLVNYDSAAQVYNNLTNQSGFAKVKANISTEPGGATNIGDGLRKAYWQLRNNSSDDKKKFIVLLTDGEPTMYSYYKDYNPYNSYGYDYYYYHYLVNNVDDINKYSTAGGGNNDSDGRATKYAKTIAEMLGADNSINSFMIAFSKDATNNKLSEISSVASNNKPGFYKEATTAEDLNDVYDKIAETILSDLPIYGLQLQETFPSGIDIVDVSNGLKIDRTNNKKIIGDIGNINYKLDTVNHVFKASPINFWVKLKGSSVGDYVLGKNASVSTSFVNYKDIDGKDVNPAPSFPPININIYDNQPPAVDAMLTNGAANDNYNLSVNVDKPSNIVVKALQSSSVPIATQGSANYVINGTDYTYNFANIPVTVVQNNINNNVYSLSLEATDAKNTELKTIETVPLTSVKLVKGDNNTTNNLLIQTEMNSNITEVKLNGNIILSNQVTDSNGTCACNNVNINEGNNIVSVTVVNSYNNTSQTITNINLDKKTPNLPKVSISIYDADSSKDKCKDKYEADSTNSSEKVNTILDPKLILKGNAVAQIEVKDEKLKNVKYNFVQTPQVPSDGELININDTIKQEIVYPDLIKDKVGYLKSRNYDVSSLPVKSNETVWNDRSQVFAKPSSIIEDRSAKIASAKGSENSNTYDISDYIVKQNGSFKNYTIFMNDMNIGNSRGGFSAIYDGYKEASKFWGYITPPETGDYYFGTISDDGSKGYIIVDGQKIQIVDQFKIQGSTFKTDNNKMHLEKGKYYPIYLEYSNWGGRAEFRLLYRSTPFNSISESTGGINVPADWFRPTTNTEPGETSTATFESTAIKGVPFPDKTGTYYIAYKAENEAGGVRQGVYGPFLVDKNPPTIELQEAVSKEKGQSIITATITDNDSGIEIQKYAAGDQKSSYFATDGTIFTGTTFTVSQDGIYTVYAKDKSGNESVKTIDIKKSMEFKKGIFVNGKLIDADINIVKSLDVNIGIGIKTNFNNKDITLQINKSKDNIVITDDMFDLYEITDEGELRKLDSGVKVKGVTDNKNGQEVIIETSKINYGYKYYLFVFKMKAARNAQIGPVRGNTIKMNSTPIVDKDGKPFEFQFNIVDLPPLQ